MSLVDYCDKLICMYTINSTHPNVASLPTLLLYLVTFFDKNPQKNKKLELAKTGFGKSDFFKISVRPKNNNRCTSIKKATYFHLVSTSSAASLYKLSLVQKLFVNEEFKWAHFRITKHKKEPSF